MSRPFDPRPLRIAAIIAVTFLVVPGSTFGAAMLWTLAGGVVPPALPLVAPSTHAMLQLGGGFMTLIWAFLAIGVPHLLGLDGGRARRILGPIAVVATALALDVTASLTGHPNAMIGARCIGLGGALLGAAVFAAARDRSLPLRSLAQAPLPFIVVALALYPIAWLLYVLEPSGVVPAGVSGEVALFLVVVPVVMSMGWKMFSAMLQLDDGDPHRLTAAIASWMLGGALVVLSRLASALALAPEESALAHWCLLCGAPLLLAGACLWLASLHGLRRRRGGLALIATAGPELRAHVVVGAVSLLLSPVLWLAAGATGAPGLQDLARHVLAIGFVFAITMGVTLRALPRFCRGRESSPRLAFAALSLLVLGVALRFGRLAPEDGALFVRASALLTLAAVVLWGAHLLRGLREVRASGDAQAGAARPATSGSARTAPAS